MNRQRNNGASRFLVLLVVLMLGAGGALAPARAAPLQPAVDYAWTAYNDCSGTTGGNTTAYSYTGATTGLLKNYDTGDNTAVTVTITKNGSVTQNTSYGAYSAEGKDAYTTFYNKANMVGVNNYASSTGWYYDLTFTGLDSAKSYTFAATANRNDSGYSSRASQFTISDTDAATNTSTAGVSVVSNESVAFGTGYNTVNGYVARWTGIQPGSDGSSLTLTQTGGAVESTPIYVRLTGASEGSFSGDITHLSSGASQKNVPVSGSVALANDPPETPVLVSPTDDATGVVRPPTLEVTVTDPDDDEMCTTFYGREAGAGGGESFTLFVYPDTQSHAAIAPATFNSMSQYIADNKTDLNIAFATHVGDIVNTSSNSTEWQRADAAFDILDAAGVPYSVGPGNHDVAMGATSYPSYFGSARFSGYSWYGGYYTSGGDNYNNYSLFSAGGMDFILINLQYQVGSAALDWADALLKTHSDRRGIIEQHDMLNLNNTWLNQAAYTALSDNPNLFLMLCGHMHTSSDGSAYRLETRTGMDPVHVLLTDYQDYNTAPNVGFLRILTFKPAADEIDAQVYSPYTGVSLTSASNYEQFTMAYDMDGAAPFEELGQVCSIASGANASLSWTGLSENTEYEWYAVVSDGSESTTGPTWSFTTGSAAPTCYALTLGHTGSGTTPAASPTNSAGCPAGQYVSGESINLSGATPGTGWGIASWSGTGDDDSTASTNSLTMPASAHAAGVNYLHLLGDVNADGFADSTDALIVLSADAGISTSAYCPMNYGDVNADGAVNSTDALIILSHDVGMTVSYPVGQPAEGPSLTTQPPGCGS